MARKLRMEYPGAVYHVMNRGERRDAIFKDDQDRQTFLSTLAKAAGKVALAVELREKTAVTVKWIAERLQMGSPGYLNHLLYQRRKAGRK